MAPKDGPLGHHDIKNEVKRNIKKTQERLTGPLLYATLGPRKRALCRDTNHTRTKTGSSN